MVDHFISSTGKFLVANARGVADVCRIEENDRMARKRKQQEEANGEPPQDSEKIPDKAKEGARKLARKVHEEQRDGWLSAAEVKAKLGIQ